MSSERNQPRRENPPLVNLPPRPRPGRPIAGRPTRPWPAPIAAPVAESPTYAYRPADDAPAAGRWRAPLAWLALLAAVALAVALFLAAAAYLYYDSDYILPGVQAAGVEVGGRTRADAAILLQRRWAAQVILLDAAGDTRSLSPSRLGLTLDAAATIDQAHRQGRSLDSLTQLLRSGGAAVAPIWRFDPAAAAATLEELAPQLARPAADATLRVVNGWIEITEAAPGRALDLPATLAALQQQAPQALAAGRFQLVVVPTQPAVAHVTALADQARQTLALSHGPRAYDPVRNEVVNWTIPPAAWNGWASAEPAPADPGRLAWTVDPAPARAYLTGQMQSLGDGRTVAIDQALAQLVQAITGQPAPSTLRIHHPDRQHVVQSGETLSSIGRAYGIPYPWIQQANPGLGDGLRAGQTIAIPSPDVMLPLPPVENKRIVVSIAQQRVWVYENGALKWEWAASTGIASSPTAPGVFQVQSHELNAYAGNWDLWMPYFVGIYRPVPTSDFMNGFHGFPTRDGSQLLWTGNLGRPVTFGCILLSTDNAIALYNWAEDGVVVELRP